MYGVYNEMLTKRGMLKDVEVYWATGYHSLDTATICTMGCYHHTF